MNVMKCALLAALGVFGLTAGAEDSLGNIGETKLKGFLGQRLDAMIARHVGGTDVDYITACFQEKTERRGWWQTEFWGKYMHSAVPYAAYSGSAKLRADIDRGIDRILGAQEANGYIGNYPDDVRCGEGWDVWGMKYTLLGLIHHYDLTKSEKTLAAARRLCDYVIAELGPNGRRGHELWTTGNWSGYASSSILEPVMWLYDRTKERKYLDFAAYVVRGMTEPPTGPRLRDLALKGVAVADREGIGFPASDPKKYVMKHGRRKAYEMMSCYQGLIEYALVTGRRDLIDAAVKAAESILRDEINLAGGCASSEQWFHGAKKQHLPYDRLQETCVTTTWLRFCEKLLDVTGEVRWAEAIERTFYNAYLAALKPDGSVFACYTPLTGNRWPGMHHCYMDTNCCTANGPRGFLCFLRKLCVRTDEATTLNFYTTALTSEFDIYSLYPRDGFVRIVSHIAKPRTLRLRVPETCAKPVLKVNDETVAAVPKDGYLTLSRTWKLGDVVVLTFDLPVVAHKLDHAVAFTRGPILLARDSRFADGDLSEPFHANALGDGQVVTDAFREVRTPSDEMWMAFSAVLPFGCHPENPESAKPTAVSFCDYASAGNAFRRDNFYRTWFPEQWNWNE